MSCLTSDTSDYRDALEEKLTPSMDDTKGHSIHAKKRQDEITSYVRFHHHSFYRVHYRRYMVNTTAVSLNDPT